MTASASARRVSATVLVVKGCNMVVRLLIKNLNVIGLAVIPFLSLSLAR